LADKRRTEIIESTGDMVTEDLIPKEDDVITISHSGYIKRISVDSYRQQHRGGKGVIGMETKEEDFVSDLFHRNTHDTCCSSQTGVKCTGSKFTAYPQQAGRRAGLR